MVTEITHSRLVKAGAAWLGKKCRVVCTELTTSASETPDVIGWSGHGYCTVIECKVSRADFNANKHKGHERHGFAVGDERWFLFPSGIVSASDIPPGWGLLEYTPSGHKNGYFMKQVVKPETRHWDPYARREERRMLISIAGRALEAASRLKSVWLGEEEE